MKFRNLVVSASLICLFATCKKEDNPYTTEPEYSGPIQVAFNNYVDENGEFGFVSKALPFKDTVINADIELKIVNTRGTAPNDIKIYLAKNDAIVTDYNTVNGTSYTVVSPTSPALTYDFSVPVVIKKGERVAKIPMTINPSKITGAAGFGIVVQKVEGAQIQELQNKLVVAISALNKYDGIYRAKGYGFLGTNTAAPYLFSVDCSFGLQAVTTGTNSIDLDAQPLYRSTGTTAGFTNVIPRFTFDPATNKVVSVTPSSFTVGTSISFQYPVDGGTYDSRYDPATKTIYVKFGLNNNATWRIIDTLVYCGPR